MNEQQKDTVKKEVKDVQKKGFVKLQDLTREMFEELETVAVRLEHKVSRKGYAFDTIYLELHDLFPITLQLKPSRFNVLRLKLGLELKDKMGKPKTSYNIKAKIRFVKGVNEIREYKSIEIIFDQFLYETYFINDFSEMQLLDELEKMKELNIKWIERPDKVSEIDTINYSGWDQ